jgi:phosphatidate cytidylyltransferase
MQRIVSALVLIPIVGIAVYLGGAFLFALVAIAVTLAAWEYLALVKAAGAAPSRVLTIALTAGFLAEAQWPSVVPLRLAVAVVAAAPLIVEVLKGSRAGALPGWALGVAGAVYLGVLAGHIVSLRAVPQGTAWLALALVCTWICDTGAYAVGRAWGRRPFFPRISPKKTWEGALGGLATGTVATVGLGYWWLGLSPLAGALLGVLIVLAATFGDLAESVIKRQVGAKDSGALIPGHGGMLDRIDSLLFVVPAVYYFAVYAAASL